MPERVCVILNPASGRGRGTRILPAVKGEFARLGVTDIRLTGRAGEERELAVQAVRDGVTTIVAAGGDGTWSNVANGVITAGGNVRIAFLAGGTGNDFAKTMRLPATDIAATAEIATGPDTRTIDVGRLNERYFINSCGFGFDAAVLEDASRVTWLRGDLVYIYAALRQLFFYRGVQVGVAEDGRPALERRVMMLIAANARHLGGAFIIAPDAVVDDGLLDVVSIGDASPLGRLKLFIAAARGTHVRFPSVTVTRAATLKLRFESPPACQRDGERDQLGSGDVEIACVRRALRVAARH